MKNNYLVLIILLALFLSCNNKKGPVSILQKTISTIDTIETIFYKQDMVRTNPRNVNEVISRYREFYYLRLKEDSIIGAKAHLYFFDDDKFVWNEDIFDGDKVIRKNNRDSAALVYDLIKYPEFRERPFWGHNTPYSMQYMFKFMLDHPQDYSLELISDTLIQEVICYQIKAVLEDKFTMPGFASAFQEMEGNVFVTKIYIDQSNYYPKGMRLENYSKENPEQISFTDQLYYGLKFNVEIDEEALFDTSGEILKGFEINERKPVE